MIPAADSFRKVVERLAREDVRTCYQCGKCSAGCPVAYAMDFSPRRIMRAIQLGMKDEALKSTGIWLCVGCQVCSLRCPKEIDVARVMESLRHLCLEEGRAPGEKDIALAYDTFLREVKRFDRVFEAGLGLEYNLRSRHLMNNMGVVPQLLAKGKLNFLPHVSVKRTAARIAKRVKQIRKKRGSK